MRPGRGRVDLSSHELESLRRSLAVGKGLPADQNRRLLDNCTHPLQETKTAEQRDDQVRAELTALREQPGPAPGAGPEIEARLTRCGPATLTDERLVELEVGAARRVLTVLHQPGLAVGERA